MSSNNEHSNVYMYNNKVVKYVNENEASRYSIVYPPSIMNTLLIEQPVFNNTKGKYKVVMKRLHPFPISKRMNIKISSNAFKMLSDQLNRLHNLDMTHSNLKAAESRLKNPSSKIDVFAPLKRQLLVEYNNDTISKIYLTNFNRRRTSDTKHNERTYVNKFIMFYNKATNNNTRINMPPSNYQTPKRIRF